MLGDDVQEQPFRQNKKAIKETEKEKKTRERQIRKTITNPQISSSDNSSPVLDELRRKARSIGEKYKK